MAPRSKIQFEEIRKEKMQLIMDSALELFAQFGYETTSINRIARKAGISKGLMYNYFQSKEQLIEAILNKGIDEMLNIFDINKDGEIVAEELEFYINESFKMIKEKRIFWKLYYSVTLQPSVFRLIEKKIDEMYTPVFTKMVNYFKSSGFENPEIETVLFYSLIDGVTFDYVFKPDLFPLDIIKKEIIKRYCRKKN